MDSELAPIVSLNVGGKKFTTSRDTLCKVCCVPVAKLMPECIVQELRALCCCLAYSADAGLVITVLRVAL